MRKVTVALVFLLCAVAAGGGDKPKPIPFEGKHPVFVVLCAPGWGCTGFYADKSEVVRHGIPKCSDKITNWCYR